MPDAVLKVYALLPPKRIVLEKALTASFATKRALRLPLLAHLLKPARTLFAAGADASPAAEFHLGEPSCRRA
jgi:hypothetical protein